jgi:hypothetical protein
MLIIVPGIRPVTSLFLIILTTKTRRAPESGCQLTAIACSIVGRPPRNSDANRDRQCALRRGDQARARRAQARALHRWPGNGGLCGADGQEQPAGRGDAAFARYDPQACGRTHSRQRGLSPRGAAQGALAAPLFALRKKHALWQPCRRRADGRHAHRRLVHALPVRADELRGRRAHDRKRGRRGNVQARCRDAGRVFRHLAPPRHRRDAGIAPRRGRLGEELRSRPGAAGAALRFGHRAAPDICPRRQIGGVPLAIPRPRSRSSAPHARRLRP